MQVIIFVTFLNFAVTGWRILLLPLSSSRGVIPSRKIALNSNGEVKYWELVRRPWTKFGSHKCLLLRLSCLVLDGVRLFCLFYFILFCDLVC